MEGQDILDLKLFELVSRGFDDWYAVKRLLEAKANPCVVIPGRATTTIAHALSSNQLDVVRIIHAQWPDIDPPRFGYKPLLYWCLTAGMWSQAECLMESGLPFKVVWDKFHDGVDPGHKPFILRAALYKRFIERETRCQQCVTTLLSAAWRKRYRLPKDMARAMAKEVWLTRRKEVWETEESLEQWKGLVAR